MGFVALRKAVSEIEVLLGSDLSCFRESVSAQSGASSLHSFFRYISIFVQAKIVYTHSMRLEELISDNQVIFAWDQK